MTNLSRSTLHSLQNLSRLTWCSRFCRGSSRFLCSTTCRFRPAGPGSRSTWGIGCASSCPWCKGGSGLRFCPRSLHTASRTENPCPRLVAGCCLQDSPLSLKTHRDVVDTLLVGCCLLFCSKSAFLHAIRTGQSSQGYTGSVHATHHEHIYQLSIHPLNILLRQCGLTAEPTKAQELISWREQFRDALGYEAATSHLED